MSKIELFFVLYTIGYHSTILIPEKNNALKGTLDLGEFMRWVDCWLYMACGVTDHQSLL